MNFNVWKLSIALIHDVSFVVFIQVNLPLKSHEVACCILSSKYFACLWSASKAVDCKGLPRGRKIFHSMAGLAAGFLVIIYVSLLPWVFDMTSLGGDRWKGGGAEERKHGGMGVGKKARGGYSVI